MYIIFVNYFYEFFLKNIIKVGVVMDILIYIAGLIISLIIVIKAADIFVDNLVEIGEIKGISHVVLGVTASAIGTSLPEFGSAMTAVLSHSPDIGVGIVIGSNIWNIAGILGISAFVAGYIKTGDRELKRDGFMTLLTAVILMVFMLFFSKITAVIGIILILVYLVYLWFLIKEQKNYDLEKNNKENESNSVELLGMENKESNLKKNILMSIVGMILLIVSCKILVESGVGIAETLNIPHMIIGLFALGIGTSIPELVVTLNSARKRLHSLSMGTILGSNVFNIMIGIGVPSLFMSIPVEAASRSFDAPSMIFVTALLLLLSWRKKELTRIGGVILMGVYIAYTLLRIFYIGG